MTKLVRKLKQMAKKRAHRKTVQKRKLERAQREVEAEKERDAAKLEAAVTDEIARLDGEGEEEVGSVNGDATIAEKRLVRIVGDLVLDAPTTKNKKHLSRKQMKRKQKAEERGVAISDSIAKKWDVKKRRVKVRAQIRNEDLHN